MAKYTTVTVMDREVGQVSIYSYELIDFSSSSTESYINFIESKGHNAHHCYWMVGEVFDNRYEKEAQ